MWNVLRWADGTILVCPAECKSVDMTMWQSAVVCDNQEGALDEVAAYLIELGYARELCDDGALED